MIEYWNNYQHKYYDYPCYEYWMVSKHDRQYRRIPTNQEQRRWFKDMEEDVKLRRCRSPHFLDSWNIEKRISCLSSKSWKKLNKCKHQWNKKWSFIK